MDARKGEIYTALYSRDESGFHQVIDAVATTVPEWLERVRQEAKGESIAFIGDGTKLLPAGVIAHEAPIRASDLARVALLHKREEGVWRAALPRYIRAAEAEVKFGKAPEHLPMEHIVRADGQRQKSR